MQPLQFKPGAVYLFLAVLALYSSIGISVVLSPWFSWTGNALSDLGNVSHSSVAPIFNVGLLTTGFLLILYAMFSLRGTASKTAWSLALTGFSLQVVGGLNENYGILHFYVSVLLFLMLLVTSMIYLFEKKSKLALLVLVAVIPWLLYSQQIFFRGEALPELISSLVVLPWLMSSMRNKPGVKS
jgi:hypothetical membrane protein